MTALDRPALTLTLNVHIRLAQKSDLSKMEWGGQFAHFRNLFRRAFREQLQGRRMMLVADLNNYPVGHIFVQFRSSNTHIADGRRRGYLYSFRVMDLLQGQGIGTRLIHEAEQRLLERGFSEVTIAVAKDNDGALRLYERQDYHKFAEDPGNWSYVDQKGYTHHVEEPCWLLKKRMV